MPVCIGPAGIKPIGMWPNDKAPIIKPGTILSQTPRHKPASKTLCEKPTAVERAMTSLLKRDNSIPGSPCVIPSHIAGTPPATLAIALFLTAESLIMSG